MAEFKVDGRMTVRTLKDSFKKEFEGTLRVYDGKEHRDGDVDTKEYTNEDLREVEGELFLLVNDQTLEITSLSFNSSAFQIVSLFTSMTHREGLSRERAVEDDRLKELVLCHTVKDKAYCAFLFTKHGNRIFTVDIVNFSGCIFLQ